MNKIRFGIVGLGHRGRHMFKLAADGFDCIEPAAACDLCEANWTETQWLQDKSLLASFPGARFFGSYDQMLDEGGLDAVIVETGADIHADFCRKALERNINVLTDIPVVASLAEADFLWKAAQQSRAMISVGANPNEAKFAKVLADLCAKGLLGKPYCMEAEYIHSSMPGSIEYAKLSANCDWRKKLSPIRYCTHSLGPLLAIMDEDLTRVSCFGTGMHAGDYAPGTNKDDMQCAQFQTESGVVVRIMRNGRCRAKIGHHSYRVFGTEGYFERIDSRGERQPVIRYNSMKSYAARDLIEMPGDFMPFEYADNPKAKGHGGIDYALLDHFFQAILRGDRTGPISLREGLRMTIPGIYAEESARRGGEVIKILYPWNEDWSG